MDVVTLGETMVMMTPKSEGKLKYISDFSKNLGGAESNFAIGLARLGIETGWISRLGNDSFGDYIEFFIRGEGVDVSKVIRDDKNPTGLMVKERRSIGETKVFYYRNNSAASHMQPADLDESYLKHAKILHLSGITPALSKSCRKTVYKAIDIAKANDLKISFDPNIRLKLWNNKNLMRKEMINICKKADIILPGFEEAKKIFEKENEKELINEFLEYNPEVVVMKMGEKGAIFATEKDNFTQVDSYSPDKIIDTIGAGDGFAAGFISGLLRGYSYHKSVKLGNAVGAFALTVKGDVEGLPTQEELDEFFGEKEEIIR
ncbi:MAG: sugar kinase [Bacillota bacterium]